MKKLSLIFGVMLMTILLVACTGNTPTKVAEQSVKCLIDKDYEGYVDLMYFNEKETSDKNFKDGKQQLAALLKDKVEEEYSKKKGIKSFETIKEEISDDKKTANVKIRITYGNGTNEDTDIKLRKDTDGNWKLDWGK